MSLASPSQFPQSIGLAPQQAMGARFVPIALQWTLVAGNITSPVISDDLIIEGQEGMIDNIQSMYFDNSTNPSAVFLQFGNNQPMIIPARAQGYMPVLLSHSVRYTAFLFDGSVGLFTCNLLFFNTPVQPTIWYPQITEAFKARLNVVAAVNAGNIALSLSTTGAIPVVPNKLVYVHGIDIEATGATAEAMITGSIGGCLTSSITLAAQNYNFGIDVPVIGAGGVHISKRFDPPLRGATTLNASGYVAGAVVLSVPAMGAGQTGASASMFYSFE